MLTPSIAPHGAIGVMMYLGGMVAPTNTPTRFAAMSLNDGVPAPDMSDSSFASPGAMAIAMPVIPGCVRVVMLEIVADVAKWDSLSIPVMSSAIEF